MDTKGKHIIIDCWSKRLPGEREMKNLFMNLLHKYNQTTVGFMDWEFFPEGYSGVFFLTESHFSWHTYPEHNYIAVDWYSCSNDFDTEKAIKELKKILNAETFKYRIITRGVKEEKEE